MNEKKYTSTGRPIDEVLLSMTNSFYSANGYYPTPDDAIRLTEEARKEIREEKKEDAPNED